MVCGRERSAGYCRTHERNRSRINFHSFSAAVVKSDKPKYMSNDIFYRARPLYYLNDVRTDFPLEVSFFFRETISVRESAPGSCRTVNYRKPAPATRTDRPSSWDSSFIGSFSFPGTHGHLNLQNIDGPAFTTTGRTYRIVTQDTVVLPCDVVNLGE